MRGGTDYITVLMTLTYVSLLILYHVSFSMSNMSFSHVLQKLGMVGESRHWLFNCFDDLDLCIIAYFVLRVLFFLQQLGMVGEWRYGLSNCFDDIGLYIIAYFVPRVLFYA